MGVQRSSSRLIALGLAAGLLAAACGDDDGGDGASDGAGSGSVEEWCDALILSDEGDAIFESIPTADPASLEAGMNRVVELVPDLVAASPPEIADDAEFLAAYSVQIRGVLADANYSLLDADLSELDVDRLEQVQENLDTFSLRECGRPFGGDDDTADAADTGDEDDGAFDPDAGTLREQIVQQFVAIGLTQQEAECLADNVDATDEAVLSGDETAILALFEACDIPLSRLAELGG